MLKDGGHKSQQVERRSRPFIPWGSSVHPSTPPHINRHSPRETQDDHNYMSFATARNSQRMHRDVMSGGSPPRAVPRPSPQSQGAKGGGGDTTTWHAYRDPATGREYFHDPTADVTTWTLPTTLPRDRAVASRGKAASERREPQDRSPPAKQTYKRGGGRGMRSAALAVLCVLAFNTAFLYCVTRYLVSRSALSTAEVALLRTESGSARKADQILESRVGGRVRNRWSVECVGGARRVGRR